MNVQDYIRKCFKIALKGRGYVSPNPLVGAILVKNGKVIGTGYHKKYGLTHAEVNAINNSKENIAGSTLYCNLEPCSHTIKQTPPCVPVIIKNKIAKVVISNLDPNKAVNGKGVKQLRDAGIEVTTGVFEYEGRALNKFYFKFVVEKLPYITIKIAQSIDGKISSSNKKQTWLTGNKSVNYVHKLRSEYDAVLVGAGTIKSDNPMLNVRKVKGRNPIRIIIDGKLSIPIKSRILNVADSQKTWIFTSTLVDKNKIKKYEANGIKIFGLSSTKQNLLNIKEILGILADLKITSLLIEGGANIFTQFIDSGLYDEVIILQAPLILGKGINSSTLEKMKRFKLLSTALLGDDIKLIYGNNLSD